MRVPRLAALCCCSLLLAARQVMGGADPVAENCRAIDAKPPAEPRLTGPLAPAALPGCSAEALYYGYGSKPDYAAALQCAWYERAHQDPQRADIFAGPGVLSMLYANGRGTARNIDLAKQFTCEQSWAAPAETADRLLHLEAMRDDGDPAAPFDLCDDATSGLTSGFCASVGGRLADDTREVQLSRIAAALTPAQRQLYEKLRAAEGRFEEARGNEVDMTGTLRLAFAVDDRTRLRDQFLINLQRFSRGDVPAADAAAAAALDAQMNERYQKIMHAPERTFAGTTVNAAGIRDTQRAWLPLRDAWLEFAAATYPRLTRERVLAQLLRLRLGQLRRLPIDLQ